MEIGSTASGICYLLGMWGSWSVYPEGTYSIEVLHEWKKAHEDIIGNAGKTTKYDSYDKLHIEIARLLIANKSIFDNYGPHSTTAQSDPTSNAYLLWELRRIDRIIPNNQKILNIIDANIDLINDISAIHAIEKFRLHAESYEKHIYHRMDSYQLFPNEFSEIFSL